MQLGKISDTGLPVILEEGSYHRRTFTKAFFHLSHPGNFSVEEIPFNTQSSPTKVTCLYLEAWPYLTIHSSLSRYNWKRPKYTER